MDIYIFRDGKQWGPIPEAELPSYVAAGTIAPADLAWKEGLPGWIPLADLLGSPAPAAMPPPPLPAPVVYTAPTQPVAAAHVPTAASVPLAEQVLWEGHPTFWNWIGSIIIGVITLPILIGIFILLRVFLARYTSRYRVTNKRVSMEMGIFTRTSNELRIQDIRSIGVRKNIFGVGTIEFSTAARDASDVVFAGIWNTEKVQALVKTQQE